MQWQNQCKIILHTIVPSSLQARLKMCLFYSLIKPAAQPTLHSHTELFNIPGDLTKASSAEHRAKYCYPPGLCCVLARVQTLLAKRPHVLSSLYSKCLSLSSVELASVNWLVPLTSSSILPEVVSFQWIALVYAVSYLYIITVNDFRARCEKRSRQRRRAGVR